MALFPVPDVAEEDGSRERSPYAWTACGTGGNRVENRGWMSSVASEGGSMIVSILKRASLTITVGT